MIFMVNFLDLAVPYPEWGMFSGHACAIERIVFYRTVTGKSDQTSNNVTLQALTSVIILKCKQWNKML